MPVTVVYCQLDSGRRVTLLETPVNKILTIASRYRNLYEFFWTD